MSFRLTYATMFDPPEAMHLGFETALEQTRAKLGARYALFINGADRATERTHRLVSPIDTDMTLGEFPLASRADVSIAIGAAAAAQPAWRKTSPAERAKLLRHAADIMAARVYEIAAALALEVGKNRMEALGEAQETIDFFRCYADDFEQARGYDRPLPNDPLEGIVSTNRSVMRPYGVWAVIAPFNFPLALAGGPAAAAMVTGNTVVIKSATDTPWACRIMAECIRDAGAPAGVFNYLSGSGAEAGAAMATHPLVAGMTFTGSAAVGLSLVRSFVGGAYPKPCLAEMGGKNPCIITAEADLERAATGVVRSAYGLDGQKCSALSRLYVDKRIADDFIARLKQEISGIRIGNPTKRENWLGAVINERAYNKYAEYAARLRQDGANILIGGRQLTDGELARGYYVEPILAEAPLDHPLWREEMFLPILMLHRTADREEAMRLANDTDLGLTAGVYGSDDDVAWFHEHVEAGVTYANRAQGATTGAWPGYQPFGGWKGSSSTGKAIASFHYLAQYMREQSRTVVE